MQRVCGPLDGMATHERECQRGPKTLLMREEASEMRTTWKLMLGTSVGMMLSCAPEGARPDSHPRAFELGTLRQQVLASCPHNEPAIDMERELVVRHLSVVNDACRTQSPWNGTAPCVTASSKGKWNFGYLMSQIAGTADPQVTSDFVIKWLNTWSTDQVVNGHLLGPRSGMSTKILTTWKSRSGCTTSGSCTLDFNQAPFRLLAIVNRIDLAGDAYGTIDAPGELRFVFNFIDYSQIENSATQHGAMKATVILEYKLTPRWDTFDWAYHWHNLGTRVIPSEAYNSGLEQITNWVTAYDTMWNGPAGSALSQVRTNELEFDPEPLAKNRVWEFREQKRFCTTPAACMLRPDTVKQTPDNQYNQTPALDSYLINNSSLIDNEDLSTLPTSMISGASRSKGSQGQQIQWGLSSSAETAYEPTGPFKMLTRHKFALQTCNGCHYAETGTTFYHIAPRAKNAASQLSSFLAPSDMLAINPNPSAPNTPFHMHTPTDPFGDTRIYNDMWRRKCEMQRLLHFEPNQLFKPSGGH